MDDKERGRRLMQKVESHEGMESQRILGEDLDRCKDKLNGDDKHFWRRVYVRGFFALVEASMADLRSLLLLDRERPPSLTLETAAEYLALSEKSYRIAPTGKLEEEAPRLPFSNYVAFTLRTAAVGGGLDPQEWFGDDGWNQFRQALKTRDRLAHPKEPQDLEVTDVEVVQVTSAYKWFAVASVKASMAAVGAETVEFLHKALLEVDSEGRES